MTLWARGAAVPLLILASWWAGRTEALRNLAGESIAVAALGVVAVFILRGMNLPLGLWPEGPIRRKLDVKVVALVALMFVLLVVAPHPEAYPGLEAILDPTALAVASVGVGALAVSAGLVEQWPVGRWYGIAAGAALLPVAVGLALAPGSTDLCVFSAGPGSGCEAALVPALSFGAAVAVPMTFVTEELAFRRMLLGRGAGAGLALVLGAALAASLWWALAWRGAWSVGPWFWALGAVAAGGLYALSGSLIVSAWYSGLLLAGQFALRMGLAGGSAADAGAGRADWAVLGTQVTIAVGFCAWVYRENGLMDAVEVLRGRGG
ncbi:MAG: hypothetical protein ACE5PT_02995 [Gemmatimonadales bacterium]